eukprot:6000717-Pyramimonas_sp.AAC.1
MRGPTASPHPLPSHRLEGQAGNEGKRTRRKKIRGRNYKNQYSGGCEQQSSKPKSSNYAVPPLVPAAWPIRGRTPHQP